MTGALCIAPGDDPAPMNRNCPCGIVRRLGADAAPYASNGPSAFRKLLNSLCWAAGALQRLRRAPFPCISYASELAEVTPSWSLPPIAAMRRSAGSDTRSRCAPVRKPSAGWLIALTLPVPHGAQPVVYGGDAIRVPPNPPVCFDAVTFFVIA